MPKVNIGKKSFEVQNGETFLQLIDSNMKGAKYNIVAVKTGDKILDLSTPVTSDMDVEWVAVSSDEGLDILRHSSSHIMALAVRRLFPGTKIAFGPAVKDGFYYDFDSKHRFSEEDFETIENVVKKLIDEDIEFKREMLDKKTAIEKYTSEGEIYKVELLNDLEDGEISTYISGEFVDICRGPHIPSAKYIKAFKMMTVAGAYWKGNEKNKMLQRLYATSFPDPKALKKYLNMLAEAKERDHRKIGKEMGLFAFYPEGPGFPFWKPDGMVLYNAVVDYWKEIHKKYGYVEVKTPIMLNEELWHQSGHWDNYHENMYFTNIDDYVYAVKPMNCPGGLLIYKDGIHSYRELPMKVAELGLVHRHEKSGQLHGLFRVRQFTQDDAHIYCTEDQVKDEVKKVIKLVQKIYGDFGFENVHLELSTRPEKSIGSDEIWEISEKALQESLEELELEYELNPGDGAFYGPKIDFHIQDAIGRSWQCGTIQCDFSLPQRFDISYIGQDGKKHQPVMLHRAILGSVERFIGILIEHYKGKFPLWLSPKQISILPIADSHKEYANEVKNILQNFGFRVIIDQSDDTLGTKIKQARLDRVCYLCIIGDKETSDKMVTVRKADSKNNEQIMLDKLSDYFKSKLYN